MESDMPLLVRHEEFDAFEEWMMEGMESFIFIEFLHDPKRSGDLCRLDPAASHARLAIRCLQYIIPKR